MLNSRRRIVGALMALALVAGLGATLAAPAVGGPQSLTLAQAKKLFLKKKKAQRTYLTKASASATYLSKTSAASTYLPRSGETRVPILPSSWVLADNTAQASVTNRPTYSSLSTGGVASEDVDFFASVAAPGQLAGLPTKVVGMEVCYVIDGGAQDDPTIDRIALQAARGAIAPTSLSTLYADGTGRVDTACTTIRFTPVALQPNDLVGVGLRIDYADANTTINVGPGSLILTT